MPVFAGLTYAMGVSSHWLPSCGMGRMAVVPFTLTGGRHWVVTDSQNSQLSSASALAWYRSEPMCRHVPRHIFGRSAEPSQNSQVSHVRCNSHTHHDTRTLSILRQCWWWLQVSRKIMVCFVKRTVCCVQFYVVN